MDKEKFINDIVKKKETDGFLNDLEEFERERLDYDAERYRKDQEEKKNKLFVRSIVSGVITVLGTVMFLKLLRPYRKVYLLVEPYRKA